MHPQAVNTARKNAFSAEAEYFLKLLGLSRLFWGVLYYHHLGIIYSRVMTKQRVIQGTNIIQELKYSNT